MHSPKYQATINNTNGELKDSFIRKAGSSVLAKSEFQGQSAEEHNFNYYHEYCRLFIANVVLTNQMKELVSEKNDLLQKLQKLEKKSEDLGDSDDDDDKKKRFRRTASQIDRHYKCPSDNCQKSYGQILNLSSSLNQKQCKRSEGSLNQHLRLKHPDLVLRLNLKFDTTKESQYDSLTYDSISNQESEVQKKQRSEK